MTHSTRDGQSKEDNNIACIADYFILFRQSFRVHLNIGVDGQLVNTHTHTRSNTKKVDLTIRRHSEDIVYVYNIFFKHVLPI